MITEKDLDLFLSYEEKIHNRINEIMAIANSVKPINGYDGDFNYLDISKDKIEVELIEYSRCSCCSDETHYFHIATDLLYESNYDVKQKYVIENAEEEAKKAEQKKKNEEAAKAKKQEQLDKLLAEKELGEF